MSYSSEYIQYMLDSLKTSFTLVNDLSIYKNKDELSNVLTRIVSASKMEGQTEIAEVAEHILATAKAVGAGSVISSDSTKDLLKDALQQIEMKLNNTSYSLKDKQQIAKLIDLLKNTKREDHDYIFLKKLNVLYIDKDSFSRYSIIKHTSNSLNVDSCPSCLEALEKLKKGINYDMILCDFNLSDKDMIPLFEQYSKRIPTVSLSTSGDSSDINLATKMGSMDIIVKNDQGIKMLPRHLNKVAREWQKQDSKHKLFDSRTKKVLKRMLIIDAPIDQTTETRISFIDATNRIPVKDIEDMDAVEDLVSSKFLTREPMELTICCPKCHSTNLKCRYICEHCTASDFVKGDIIEHNKCGHADLERAFGDNYDNKMICPKCNRELKLIGVDYFRLESAFKCRRCSNIMSLPYYMYDCNNCNNSEIRPADLSWKQLYKYSLVQSKVAEVKKDLTTFDKVEKYLLEMGFKVNVDYKVESKSESYGPYDLVAQREGIFIVIATLGMEVEKSFSKLLELDKIDNAISSGRILKYVILFSEPREAIRNIINKFNLIPLLVQDSSRLLDKFREKFSLEYTTSSSL
jgi:CheY-like chemotaxis protein